MKKLYYKLVVGTGIGLLSSGALAASSSEQPLTTVTDLFIYAFILFAVVVIGLVYFARFQDKRQTPLEKLFTEGQPIHSVAPDALVTECVRTMSAKKIGALIVINGDKLAGIFTERDALNKVLAAGLEPSRTKVSDVMTKDPFFISPKTTVGEAMELVTTRRFRHLPIVKNGKVLAVISSGDLTYWLVKNKIGEVQDLVELGAEP